MNKQTETFVKNLRTQGRGEHVKAYDSDHLRFAIVMDRNWRLTGVIVYLNWMDLLVAHAEFRAGVPDIAYVCPDIEDYVRPTLLDKRTAKLCGIVPEVYAVLRYCHALDYLDVTACAREKANEYALWA